MLTIHNVSKSFKIRKKTDSKLRDFFHPKFSDFKALNSLSFSVKQGEKVALHIKLENHHISVLDNIVFPF
jgi:ABC-type polysaccharide/polyol phosphate transport system ATPase subunit